jgi:type II secretory pathway pseudopilin PulG
MMRATRCHSHYGLPQRRSQQGQIILVTVLLLGLAIAISLFSLIRSSNVTLEDNVQTERALALAKDALIAYASGRPTTNRPGELPCPDTDNDGLSNFPCDSATTQIIGRFPWRTLRIEDLRDGSAERLWYTVSNNFKNDPPVAPLNSNTPGQLTVTGTSPATNVIAIVFAAGSALPGQNRNAANVNNIAHYLEGENSSGANTIFETGMPNGNDQLIAITPSMLFPQVEMRAAREARSILNQYFIDWGFYPVAYSFGSTGDCAASNQGGIARRPEKCGGGQGAFGTSVPDWFWNDAWHQVLFYAMAPACGNPSAPNCSGTGGFLTVNGDGNVRAVIISPGIKIGAQNRPCTSVGDCLEPPNATSFPTFSHVTGSITTNDRVVIVAPPPP